MSTRTIFRDLMTVDETLQQIGLVEDNIVSSGSLSGDNRPPSPFAVIRWGVENPGMGEMTRRLVTIWVHDEPGTYDTIDRILKRLKAILDGVANITDGQGNWLSLVTWQSDSGDLYDPGYRTITKNSTYEIIGTGV